MNWAALIANLLVEGTEIPLEALASALFARGRYALEAKGPLPEDALLRRLEHSKLMEAALLPGPESVRHRWMEARELLEDVDDAIALQAERAVAEVLNDRDRWHVRSLGLRDAQFTELADAVTEHVRALDAWMKQDAQVLGAIAWMGDEARACAWDAANTAWALVPAFQEEEPRRQPAAGPVRPVTDEELLSVAQERADAFLERRVVEVLQRDPGLRSRYEALVEDLDQLKEPPQNVIHLPVRKMFRQTPPARARPQPLAASTQRSARYEVPEVDALIYTFDDGSELYAQRENARWVLFFARQSRGERDGFEGPLVEQLRHGEDTFVAIANPGEVRLRYLDATIVLELEALEA